MEMLRLVVHTDVESVGWMEKRKARLRETDDGAQLIIRLLCRLVG